MKVLLTGASGFIGSYVLNALQNHGIEVVAIGRTQPQATIEFIEADLLGIRNFVPLLQQAQATHLLHLAWYAEHGKYWTSPLNLRWTEATVRLVQDFCSIGGKQVIIAGTCAEYDWSYGYFRENDTLLNPDTLYGAAKDATRRLVKAICTQYQVPYAWGRIFQPFGYGENTKRLIPSLIEVFQGVRAPFEINTLAYRDFLHASDVAAGFISLILKNAHGEYNICSGEPVRLTKIIKILASLFDMDPTPLLVLTAHKFGDPSMLVGENIKLKALGWQPELTLRQGLELTIQGIHK